VIASSPAILVACVLALATGAAVVLASRPIYAAVALLAHSLVLAGLYVLLAADLVAVGQVLIYSGAIVVLFLFVVLLLPSGEQEPPATAARLVRALLGGGVLLAALVGAIAGGAPGAVSQPSVGVAPVGQALFGPLLVAFELTAPLLLVAIVGAVVMWRRTGEGTWGRLGERARRSHPTTVHAPVEPDRLESVEPVAAGGERRS
jgi:NADH-quinone oxidoreductase subunit J